MPIVDFSHRKANNLVWKTKSNLIEILPNEAFAIPEDFYMESLMVIFNGQKLSLNADYTMIDSVTFKLSHMQTRGNTILEVGYLRK